MFGRQVSGKPSLVLLKRTATAARNDPMLITRIRLRNWKNFKNAEAALTGRVFLIGPNASGKSNFLDAFRFLRDVAVDGLSRATGETRGGVSSIRCLAATRYAKIDIEIEVSSPGDDTWVYRLAFKQDTQKRPVVEEEMAKRNGEQVLVRPNADDKADPLRLTQTALEQISRNHEFRPLADFLRSITYQHLLPQVVRDPRGFSPLPVQNDPYGRDFLMRVWQTTPRTRDSRLRKIADSLQAAVPQLTTLKVEMDESGTPHLIGGYSHWRPNDAKQTENQFSDGTLRLIGLLWATFEGSGPLLLEEPELSLHPEIVRRLPTMFAKLTRKRKQSRQLIVSTHAEDLLGDVGVAAEEVLRLEPTPDGTELRSADPADREAMRNGLTAADVLMPRAAPADIHQLTFDSLL